MKALRQPRPEELWAAQMVGRALGVDVDLHDDGTADGMHDLAIRWGGDRPVGAVEVTAAADAASIELWNLMNGSQDTWIEPSLAGGWMVSLSPTARAKTLKTYLPVILAEMEAAQHRAYHADRYRQPREAEDWSERLGELGVLHAMQSGTSFPGSIYLTIEQDATQTGGMVDHACTAVPGWIGAYLRDPDRADVRRKLEASGARDRHAFVILPGFSSAPFDVLAAVSWTEGIPEGPPDLPEEVTDVWMVSTWNWKEGDTGLRWSPSGGWQRFERLS